MQPHPSTKDYFDRLDTLRFLAFFLVLVNHLTDFLRFPTSVGTQGTPAFTYFQVGDLGVGFFFVLSGFLITYLLQKEMDRTGKVSIKNFYIRRVLRIWPLYFLALAIIILISLAFRGFDLYKINLDWHEILPNLFFVGNIFKAFHYTANEMIAILWSIAVEEQFYLVWPVLFTFFRRYINWILGLGIVISLAVRYHYANQFPIREFYTLSVMVYLIIGALAGIHGSKIKSWISKHSRMLASLSFMSFLILLTIRGFVFTYSYPQWFIALDGLLFALFFAVIILAAAFRGNVEDKSMIERGTEYLGTVSYGLYIYHLIALTLVINLLARAGFDYSNLGLVRFSIIAILTFALVIVISSLSYKYYEKPFLLLKERFITKN